MYASLAEWSNFRKYFRAIYFDNPGIAALLYHIPSLVLGEKTLLKASQIDGSTLPVQAQRNFCTLG